jgi:hypothetical protein
LKVHLRDAPPERDEQQPGDNGQLGENAGNDFHIVETHRCLPLELLELDDGAELLLVVVLEAFSSVLVASGSPGAGQLARSGSTIVMPG